jgi:membrane protease YdiL (CAAX protease family)
MSALVDERRWRDSRLLIAAEFTLVAALFLADVYHHIFFSKTPYLLLLGWISLRMRGLGWKQVGFTRPRSWGKAVLWGVVAGIVTEAIELFITQPLLVRWTGKMPDLSDVTAVEGNWKLLLIFLALTWTLAAFGEELVYRGYLMNRVSGLFGNTRTAWVVGLTVVSIVFGCGHIDQGSTGMIENIWDGFLLGALYLACGRNLTAAIIAHGVTDTVDVLLMYGGKYPGMH